MTIAKKLTKKEAKKLIAELQSYAETNEFNFFKFANLNLMMLRMNLLSGYIHLLQSIT